MNERGSSSVPLMLLIAGVSVMFAQNEFKNLQSKLGLARVQNEKSFANLENMSSLQTAARLFRSDKGAGSQPLHLEPYIQPGACDANRKIVSKQSLLWQSTDQALQIKHFKQDGLGRQSNEIFSKLSSGQTPSIQAPAVTNIHILGYKCSANASSPFLVEGVYVEAKDQEAGLKDEGKITKALLAMDPPPASTCLFYLKDASGAILPSSKIPAPGEKLDQGDDKGEIFLECNHVITHAQIIDNGVKLAETPNYPITAADRIDPAYKLILGPIKVSSMGPGSHNLLAIAEQVDGSLLSSEFQLDVANPVDVNICAYQCTTLPTDVYPDLCDKTVMAHKDYYQDKDPNKYVCYQCEYYYGFDPKNNCENTGDVAKRGNEGCFRGDTLVVMENQEKKAIREIHTGDRVWNPLLKKGVRVREVVHGPEFKPLYRVEVGGAELFVTDGHPFQNQLGIVAAKDLKPGDKIQSPAGGWVSVVSSKVQLPIPGIEVWNLELDGDQDTESEHMLLANGIVTGDLFLQKRVSGRNLLEIAASGNRQQEE